MSERTRAWWKEHEAWAAAVFVAASMFALGYASAITHLSSQYATDAQRMSDAYRTAMTTKDELIARLAGSTAGAANAANTAAKAAIKAADTTTQPPKEDASHDHR